MSDHSYYIGCIINIIDDLDLENTKLRKIAIKAERLIQYEKFVEALHQNDIKIPESLGEVNEMIDKIKGIK